MKYRFVLEAYISGGKNRYQCPQCGKNKQFTRYIDTEGIIEFPDYVGRCERISKCGYSYTPRQYINENREEYIQKISGIKPFIPNEQKTEEKTPSFIDMQLVKKTIIIEPNANYFTDYLNSLVVPTTTKEYIKLYNIGTSKHWTKANIFWQIDNLGNARTGKVMQYNPKTGKRIKEPYNKINWVHSVLKIDGFNLEQCFFGEHLLRQFPQKPIGIVESEKTAIIAAICIKDFVWIATGGISSGQMTNNRAVKVLKNRDITLFPDLKAETEWTKIAEKLSGKLNQRVKVSQYLKNNATPEQTEQGWDLADFLTMDKFRDKKTGLLLSDSGYPLCWD